MANAALGSKRVCVSCAVRFYDLTRAPAVCPKCGTEQPVDVPRVARPLRGMPSGGRFRKVPPVVVEAESEAPETEAEDADETEEDEGDDAGEEEAILIDDDDEKEPVPEH